MKVLYTGSFNPFHSGHRYVFDTACKCFGKDNVWIGIGENPEKKQADIEHLKRSLIPVTRNVIAYSGLTADVVKKEGFGLLVRGIRPGHNLDDENDLLYWNRKLCGVETILVPTPPELNQISSSAIRVLDANGKDVSNMVDPFVYARWKDTGYRWDVYFGHCCSGKSTFIKAESVKRFDRLIWKNLGKVDVSNLKLKIKKAFYGKDTFKFNWLVDLIGENADWKKMFSESGTVDFPNLGTYWEYIPKEILTHCMFVKLTASMEDRMYFSQCRKANPKLIETSDFFYKEPPFFDDEIVVRRSH